VPPAGFFVLEHGDFLEEWGDAEIEGLVFPPLPWIAIDRGFDSMRAE